MTLICNNHIVCLEWLREENICCEIWYLPISLFFQENKIKEELEKKIDKLREQADINKQEIEQGKTKIEEVISSCA